MKTKLSKSLFLFSVLFITFSLPFFAQNVGIGTTTPQGELHVTRPYQWQGVIFTGSGLDDINVNHDSYTGTTERTYTVKVSNAGPDPNWFDWTDDGTNWTTNVPMSTTAIALSHGISIYWDATSGHTWNEQWSFTIGPDFPNGLIVKNASVGVGTDSPHASAKLEIVSTDKGVLIPRTDTATVNSAGTPATGLLIYQSSNNKFYYNNGTKWVEISAGIWKKTGSKVHLTSDSDNVGIGTSNPLSKLSVEGDGNSDYTFSAYSDGMFGRAVYGIASNSTYGASAYGGYFEAAGSEGTAVYGLASSTGDYPAIGGDFNSLSNYGTGVSGSASGTAGIGVRGSASHTGDVSNYGGDFSSAGNTGRGVYGSASGSSASGVYGFASHATGVNYGVYGYTASPSGYGGFFAGIGRGAYGRASGETGRGVYGFASHATGVNYGVRGQTNSPSGYGGYFSGEGTGVYGKASGSAGKGVYGMASENTGYGIYGYSSHPTGVNYGVYGKTESPDGYAGYFDGKVEITGKIKIGDDSSTPQAGSIRWNDSKEDFEGYTGTKWISLTKANGNNWGNMYSSTSHPDNKLFASDGASNDKFGKSVSIDGDYAIIGAFYDDDNGNESGSAYIFYKSGTSWIQQAKLTASDGATDDNFGCSVSISGDYVIVGADHDNDNGTNSGSSYIYHRSGTNWTQQAKLTASEGSEYDYFGCSVSIFGDYAIIGAFLNVNGSSYIYHRLGTSWTQQAKLTASDGAAYDDFGCSVSIYGDYVVIGASGNDDDGAQSGSAYIFHRSGVSWTQQEKITANDGAENDDFGCSVSISGDYVIIGAYGDNSAYIFHRLGTNWSQQYKLLASDGLDDEFGSSVSISGDYVIVGAHFDFYHGDFSGSAYIFIRSGESWGRQIKLTASDGAENDEFGKSVCIDGDNIIIGSILNDDNGSAYIVNKKD